MATGVRRSRRLARIGALLLAAAVASSGCSIGQANRTPTQWAEDYASGVVPGWNRAVANNLVVPLDITAEIPGSDATITLDDAWYSGRQTYILYTVTAPDDGYVMPVTAQLGTEAGNSDYADSRNPWSYLDPWGVFTDGGFHSVLIFGNLSVPEGTESMTLTLQDWKAVVPEESENAQVADDSSLGQVVVTLPWDSAYLEEPEPDVIPLSFEQEWNGRSLRLEEMQVGIGRIRLEGDITLLENERDPWLQGYLETQDQEGSQQLWLMEISPTQTAPGQYHFVAVADGPSTWPATVNLSLQGIRFTTDSTLEWTIPWSSYRENTAAAPVEDADQQKVAFYDSVLTSKWAGNGTVVINQEETETGAPYVTAMLYYAGRKQADQPGWEVADAAGQVDLSPVVSTCPEGLESCEGYAVSIPDSLQGADNLILRYVNPTAGLVINDSWKLTSGSGF